MALAVRVISAFPPSAVPRIQLKPPAALRNCLKNKSTQDRESKKHFLCLLIFKNFIKTLKQKFLVQKCVPGTPKMNIPLGLNVSVLLFLNIID